MHQFFGNPGLDLTWFTWGLFDIFWSQTDFFKKQGSVTPTTNSLLTK